MRLLPESKPSSGLLEGWVEEVDSGEELRFHSVDELLRFLGERFSEAPITDSNVANGQTRTKESP